VNDTVEVMTPVCRICGKWDFVAVRAGDLERYRANPSMLIQEAFPEMPIERREQLISGTHPACWDVMFSDDAEDSD
jgi:hypothetical protein